ncbi:hypothetical protein B0H10DRAFT_1944800 [Mycena sp. CBHHK59/15]|nr:hypothetical protein B0H10DRAFT_1944800 [Mycena sp. CBHHK59/15]
MAGAPKCPETEPDKSHCRIFLVRAGQKHAGRRALIGAMLVLYPRRFGRQLEVRDTFDLGRHTRRWKELEHRVGTRGSEVQVWGVLQRREAAGRNPGLEGQARMNSFEGGGSARVGEGIAAIVGNKRQKEPGSASGLRQIRSMVKRKYSPPTKIIKHVGLS